VNCRRPCLRRAGSRGGSPLSQRPRTPRVANTHSAWHFFRVLCRSVLACLVLTACGGATAPSQKTSDSSDSSDTSDTSTSSDSSTAAAETGGSSCMHATALDDGGPGACSVALAYLECTYPSGAGCGCLSDDPTACPGCGPSEGATCKNHCNANEYAVACGGPPSPNSNVVYQDVPDACVGASYTPAGVVFACCPCE
jgi:hypothetical protein